LGSDEPGPGRMVAVRCGRDIRSLFRPLVGHEASICPGSLSHLD
jgi:hypothetical protein